MIIVPNVLPIAILKYQDEIIQKTYYFYYDCKFRFIFSVMKKITVTFQRKLDEAEAFIVNLSTKYVSKLY